MAGYDNQRENIDPHIKTKVVSTKEIITNKIEANAITCNRFGPIGGSILILGNFYPGFSGFFSLGSASLKWKNLYLSGNIIVGGTVDGVDIAARDHAESHNVASHSDTTATGTELNTLTDNSIANTLHRHSELVASDGSPDPALSVDAAGKVGIGTTVPGERLVVSNTAATTVNIESTGNSSWARLKLLGKTVAGTVVDWRLISGDGENLKIYGGTTGALDTRLLIDKDGNVGIGTTSPNESLEVNGNVWADNFYVTSDRDLKTNIEVIESSSFGNLYKYKLNKSKDVYEEINKTKEKEVCEEFLITNSSEICELDKKTNETSCSEVPAIYEKQCHNETEIYTETKKVGVEYYDSEEYIGLMTDEINEDFVKTTDGVSRVNLYGLISKIWVLLGGHEDRITELENENTLIKSELCKKDNTYSWCLGAIK